MGLQTKDILQIVSLCYPKDYEESLALAHDIHPVKFGNSQLWQSIGGGLPLAQYQIPSESPYLLVTRVECYVTTFDETAVGFGLFSPPPQGTAFWKYSDITAGIGDYSVTPSLPMHLLCDSEEMILAAGDHLLELLAVTTPPDAVTRFIRTLVYGYMIGAMVADRISGMVSTYFGTTDE